MKRGIYWYPVFVTGEYLKLGHFGIIEIFG